jgi:phage tail sheath gpL-like
MANANFPVTAVASTATVTFTAKNTGLGGNDIDLRMNYRASAGQVTPAGVTATITAMASGATNPTLTTLLSNLGDKEFDFIVCPYTDGTSLAALTAFMNDQAGRWSWTKQLFGHVFAAARGTVGTLTTLGTGLNDQHLSVLGFNDSPTPNWIWAASFAAACAVSLRADPALPLHTLTMSTPLPPPIQSRFILTDRNTLLFDGISTFTVQTGGIVALEGVITTYQKNAFSQADNSYLMVVTLFNLANILRRLAGVVTSKYARVKLAADGTRFAPGSAIITPKIIRAGIIAAYKQLEFEGYVQGSAVFAANLVVQQNATNPNRVDVLYPAILIDQLDVFALLAQFRLAA